MTPVRPDEVLRVCGLALGYGAQPVVSGVEMTVREGEFWCWIGANDVLGGAVYGQIANGVTVVPSAVSMPDLGESIQTSDLHAVQGLVQKVRGA